MRVRTVLIAVLVISMMAAGTPVRVGALPRITLTVCRDMSEQDLGAEGYRLVPTHCGREFPATVPYVVLFMEVADVDYATPFSWQLYDPKGEGFARASMHLSPDPGTVTRFTGAWVLPVAATVREIIGEHPQFVFRLIEVRATPVSQMPGEWRVEASLGGAASTSLRFTLRP